MRLLIALALAALPCGASAQVVYATKADIAAAAARAKAAIQPGHGTSSTPVAVLGGYTAKLEYHVGPNIAGVHPGQAELFEAIEGSGTLTTGGTIVKTGTTAVITGGTARPVAAGDLFIVPPDTPHWFNQVDGHLILISVMLPVPK
jgi:mannose-6-phosphate isomerase-like protein (cupin superfamily)